nr:hypothetical protein [Mycoplasmopsis bovis]
MTYIPKEFITDHTKEICWFDYFWGLFGKCAYTGEILVADQSFRTKAITELLEQNKNVKYLLPLKKIQH